MRYYPQLKKQYEKNDITEEVASVNYNLTKNSMQNLTSNTAFLALAISSLGGVVGALQTHDFSLAAGLFVFGVAMVVLYEKTPPTATS